MTLAKRRGKSFRPGWRKEDLSVVYEMKILAMLVVEIQTRPINIYANRIFDEESDKSH